MRFNVKNTIIRPILDIVVPHHCFGCHKAGSIVCESCKYNIVSDSLDVCLECGLPSTSGQACAKHQRFYTKAWFAGEKTDVIDALIDSYKFYRLREGCHVIAELIDAAVPRLPDDAVVVPIPTIRKHIRQRGYDHTYLLAKEFAKKQNIRCENSIIYRKTNTQQRGKTRKERLDQASKMFGVKGVCKNNIYVLLDDVYTTGATVNYASKALKDAGAFEVWVVVASKQPNHSLV